MTTWLINKRVQRWLAVYLLCWAVGLACIAHPWTSQASADVKGTVYTVKPGDTMWSIASRFLPGVDPRQAVDRLTEYNHLSDGPIYPGEQIQIPPTS